MHLDKYNFSVTSKIFSLIQVLNLTKKKITINISLIKSSLSETRIFKNMKKSNNILSSISLLFYNAYAFDFSIVH
jgi:hypothetical protein